MRVEFAYAASSATAVAPRYARCVDSAWAGRGAASMMPASPAGTHARSGHDGETGWPRHILARAANGTGMTVVPVDMAIGMQLAAVRALASPIFMTARRVCAAAIVDDVAARAWGTSAGFAEAACSDVAFLGGAGSEDGPKKGVTTYDVTMSGQQAVRHGVATKVTGS